MTSNRWLLPRDAMQASSPNINIASCQDVRHFQWRIRKKCGGTVPQISDSGKVMQTLPPNFWTNILGARAGPYNGRTVEMYHNKIQENTRAMRRREHIAKHTLFSASRGGFSLQGSTGDFVGYPGSMYRLLLHALATFKP